jgi:hypothetical protein
MFSRSYRLRATACACAVCLVASVATGQSPTSLAEEGVGVPGVGSITAIDGIAINDSGNWLIEADTDHANPDADSIVLGIGGLYLREGQGLSLPVGASLDSFGSININASGNSGWNFLLGGTSGTNDNHGLYRNTNLLLQTGAISSAPEFTPGTVYLDFVESKINDHDTILLMAVVDDSAIAGSTDCALVRFLLDGGSVVSERVIAMEGDLLAGQTEVVEELEAGVHSFALNRIGDVLFVADLAGDPARDHTIYLNDTLLAQEGFASPLAGRPWVDLSGTEVNLNDNRDHVFHGAVAGELATSRLVVKNGEKFRQAGDMIPSIAPHQIVSFGSGPLCISNGAEVLWYGDWDDPDPDIDSGLFVNDELIVQEGVTIVSGRTVDTLRGVESGYAMSPSGRYVIFEAVLSDGTEGAFLVDRGAQATTTLRIGSGLNPLRYTTETQPRIGSIWRARVDPTGYSTTLTVTAGTSAPLDSLFISWGEVLIDLTTPTLFVSVSIAGSHSNYIPNDPAYVGYRMFTQGAVVTSPMTAFNALDVTIGP